MMDPSIRARLDAVIEQAAAFVVELAEARDRIGELTEEIDRLRQRLANTDSGTGPRAA
jgi:uncharacterized small protein (DUF1192 family)